MPSARLVLLAMLAVACTSRDGTRVPVTSVVAADTVVPAGSERLGRPRAIAAGDDGLLYVSDRADQAIHVLDAATGAEVRRIGRSGDGPGELRMPERLGLVGDTLIVADNEHLAYEVFHRDGTFARRVPGPDLMPFHPPHWHASGGGRISFHGMRGRLAARLRPDGTIGTAIGHPRPGAVDDPIFADIEATMRQLAAGRLPDAILAYNLAAPAADDGTWIAFIADGLVRRYDARDSLRWERPLDDSLRTRLLAPFIAAAQGPPDARRFPMLVRAIAPAADALWMTLAEPDGAPALLLRLPDDGGPPDRLLVTGASTIGAMALATDEKTLYLLDEEDGAILRVRLPAVGR